MTSDQINYLNIGLMLVAFVAALVLPFEVFLISYAILGPLHYLTEISWLHDRNYFSLRRRDWIPLVFLAVLFVLGASNIMGDTWAFWEAMGLGSVGRFLDAFNYELLFVAFGLALILVFVKDWKYRGLWTALLLLLAWLVYLPAENAIGATASARVGHPMVTIFGIYLPTLIHTYLFTGAFILFGALKRSSRSGYASFLVFLLCFVGCFALWTDGGGYVVSDWARSNYSPEFQALNLSFVYDFTRLDLNQATRMDVFAHPLSILVARLIAFSYTYHYLNWFSKTKVIAWHKVPKLRLAAVVAVWIASVALYLYDYATGLRWLLLLSLIHVMLEFPLNHKSFLGIYEELKKRVRGRKPAGKAVVDSGK
ncbi:MAG: hypothetical protein AAF998_02400 [Bacteroidota bacterium]